MQASEVKQLIEQQLEGCEAITAGEGCDFQVVVVGDMFDGLSPVKRQQLVYGCLTEQIASGAIHAVTIKTYTPAQWQAQGN
ncbi:BolA family transcriptional regulator [Motiliproteus coralliicola]|uniref:BolA family transcriptional regulator n=1 Tax=Motiliproteus coralliicola TaxID=2283196 RepID=A0A369WKP2_9GAMM|nr:BolA family protein [Motiliproteus coralliicola]RDE22638.1 BolA family transcriptional regulator [Motiliproteus coralliicola]